MCNSAPAFQGGDTDGDSQLDETETWTYTCPHVVAAADADPLVNVATATGQDKNGNEVSDDDTATGGPDLVRRIYPTVVTITAEHGAVMLPQEETASIAESVVRERSERPGQLG